MQDLNWNDLRYLVALGQSGSFAGAGRRIGVSETTVSRRIAVLERSLNVTIAKRDETHRIVLTDDGQRLLAFAERMAGEVEGLREGTGRLEGRVRISAVPFVINRILTPALAGFRQTCPGIVVELVPETRNVDLTRREADLAVRLDRPMRGGAKTIAQRIGHIAFAAYRSAQGSAPGEEWIGYDTDHAELPQARWIADVAQARLALVVADLETAYAGVCAGLGCSALPKQVAERDAGLVEIGGAPDWPPLPVREVWLLCHAATQKQARIAATKEWLRGLGWC